MKINWTQAYNRLEGFLNHKPKPTQEIDVMELFGPPITLGGNHAEKTRMTMDNNLTSAGHYDLVQNFINAVGVDGARGIAFLGYPTLSLLEQNPLIRIVVENLSREATRRWVELKGADQTPAETVTELKDVLDEWKIRDLFRDCADTAGFQGGCMLFIDLGTPDDDLCTPLVLSPKTIKKGSLKGFRKIEPINCYPAPYNANNPLNADYFKPTSWYVHGIEVHSSRLLRFANNELNILLRPAYNFFGIPLSQLILPYIKNFERSRDASANIVDNFSLLGLKTDMGGILQGESPDDIVARIKIMLGAKRNHGVALVDKEQEEFFQINTPLSGLEGLVAQQLELLALVSGQPVTKLFGTPPKGFNTTGESDITNFYDRIKNYQEALFYTNHKKVRKVVELSYYGKTHDDILDDWPSLKDPNEKEQAEIQLLKAQKEQIHHMIGAIDAINVRTRLSQDNESDYTHLDPDDLPEPDDEDLTDEPPLKMPSPLNAH